MTQTMNQEDVKTRDALVAKYNRIPKTEEFDTKRKNAFDAIMEFEEKFLG